MKNDLMQKGTKLNTLRFADALKQISENLTSGEISVEDSIRLIDTAISHHSKTEELLKEMFQ